MTNTNPQELPDIDELRRIISESDAAITELLTTRFSATDEIGVLKARTHQPVHVPSREKVLREKLFGSTPTDLLPLYETLFDCIIACSRQRQLALRPNETAPLPPGPALAVYRTGQGEESDDAARKFLTAFAASGLVPKSFTSAPGEVRAVFEVPDEGAEALAADLRGLGAEVSPAGSCHRSGQGLLCGLLGRKLGHTLSPQIHEHFADYAYKSFECEPEALKHFMLSMPFDGLNVTIPYKETVMQYCSRLSKAAQRVGAVNTIVREADGSLSGDNTDYAGFLSTLEASGIDVKNRKALVLGTGGAAKCVVAVLEDLEADVKMVSVRAPTEVELTERLKKYADTEILINATPVGMFPNNGISPVPDLSVFPKLAAVFDLIYNPSRTQLLLDARRRGIPAFNGLHMLVVQAEAASRRFLGARGLPAENAPSVKAKILRENENIVLTGMPGSGKSTVGRLLAELLGRTFIDIDDDIETAAGCSIPEIFAQQGEPAFRELETKVTAVACARRGVVIATGGGTMMREKNRDSVHQNAQVVLLKRPLNDLPTAGRPVSLSRPLSEIWEERKSVYISSADIVVDNFDPEETARTVLTTLGWRV